MTTIEADPQVTHEVMTPVPETLLVNGQAFAVYELPPDPERDGSVPEQFATDVPETLERVLSKGLNALEDGEGFHITAVSQYDSTVNTYGFTRIGGSVVISYNPLVPIEDRQPSIEARDPLRIEGEKKVEGFFLQDDIVETGHRGLLLVDKGGKLGETVAKLGFTSEDADSPVPLPVTLGENIAKLQSAGIDLPTLRFSEEAAIDGENYVDAWPVVSMHPAYYAHDLLQEHFEPLVVFRNDAVIIGTLYAQAVQEADEIVAMVPEDEYAINRERVSLHGVALSGRAKIDYAANCLDNFTNDLADAGVNIDKDVNDPAMQSRFTEYPMNGFRYTPQMVQTILRSSHRQEFIDHLDSIGSSALNRETDEFSYETYVKEIFVRAQAFWEITPQPIGGVVEQNDGVGEVFDEGD